MRGGGEARSKLYSGIQYRAPEPPTTQPAKRDIHLADLLLDVAEGFIIEAAELLQAIDFLADLHFIERFIATLRTALLFLAEAQFSDALQDAGLLDTAGKPANERFGRLFLFSLDIDHKDLLSGLTRLLFERARVPGLVPGRNGCGHGNPLFADWTDALGEPRPAEEVEVEVLDLLPPMLPHAKEQLIPFFRNFQVSSDIPGDPEHLSYNLFILVLHLGDRNDPLLRDNKDVHRGRTIDIRKRHDFVVFIEKGSWDLPVADFLEDSLHMLVICLA